MCERACTSVDATNREPWCSYLKSIIPKSKAHALGFVVFTAAISGVAIVGYTFLKRCRPSNALRDVQRQYVILVAAVEAVEAVNLKKPLKPLKPLKPWFWLNPLKPLTPCFFC